MFSPRRKLYQQSRKFKLFRSWSLCLIIFLLLIISLLLLQLLRRSLEDKIIEASPGNELEYLTRTRELSLEFDTTWTRISDSVHVYSAHLDTRNRRGSNNNLTLIRILGLKRVPSMRSVLQRNPMEWLRLKDETYFGDKYSCRVFKSGFTSDDDSISNFGSVQGDVLTYTIIEEGVKAFASCYINCYINSTILKTGIKDKSDYIFVAIYPVNVQKYPDKLIRIESGTEVESTPGSRTLGLCVRPLFGPMDDLSKLVQFVSYYQRMGVTSMSFYDLSIGPRVRKYLNDLRKSEGTLSVSLMRWNLPTGNTSELWDYGSLAALNDCLFRRMGDAHVIFVDIDEFVVPQMSGHDNLLDVIHFYEQTSPNFYQLLLRNAFFCQEFCEVDKKNSSKSFVLSLNTCTIRAKRVLNVNMRSKYIVKPKEIVAVGHHLVTKFLNQVDHRFVRNSVQAGTDVALLNHYRECGSISERKHPILNRLTVFDDKILRFLNS